MFVLAIAGSAQAQTADERPLRRLEVEMGGGLIGGAAAGEADATLLANDPVRRPLTLFETTTRIGPAPAFHVRLGAALSRRITIEGGVVLSRPELRLSTSGDAESGPSLTIVERIDQYFFEGSVLILIDEARLGGRTVPFVAAGGGYLRQLHEGQTIIEHGVLFHAGGGLKHWFLARSQGALRGAGMRADARVYILRDNIAIEDRPRPHGAVSGSLFLVF